MERACHLHTLFVYIYMYLSRIYTHCIHIIYAARVTYTYIIHIYVYVYDLQTCTQFVYLLELLTYTHNVCRRHARHTCK